MIDTVELKERVDLVAIAERDVELRKVAADEYAGPCPKCGGDDRFHVTGTWWFCRQCHEKRGDAIEYVQWRDGMGFVEACEVLGEPYSGRGVAPNAPERRAEPRGTVPSAVWQARARAFVEWAEGELWVDPDALAYLYSRGLDDDTIRAAHLGYNPRELFDRDLVRWGVTAKAAVWLPRGWVIPCEARGVMRYVKVRRHTDDLAQCEAWNTAHPGRRKKPVQKYHAILGSHKRGALYGLDGVEGQSDLILCEGEFNALVLRRELAGAAAVVSVGDAGNVPGSEALAVLATVRRWWLAYDPDKAGRDGRDKIADAYARARSLGWSYDGDINDAYLDGVDLAAWAAPQIGPGDTDKRREWLEHHLGRLGEVAFDAGTDGTEPALRTWRVLYADMERLRLLP